MLPSVSVRRACRGTRLVLTALVACALAVPAHAQRGAHWTSWLTAPGVNGYILDAVPSEDGLVVAGAFSSITGRPMGPVVRFDGTRWESIGALPGEQVVDLAFAGGTWVASTQSVDTRVSAPRIVRWDGGAWRPLGSRDRASQLLVVGSALCAFDGQVLWRWSGVAWDTLTVSPGARYSSAMECGGQLFALLRSEPPRNSSALAPRAIVAWAGAQWQTLPPLYGYLESLEDVGGVLYAIGALSDGAVSEWPPTRTYAWRDGAWHETPWVWAYRVVGQDGPGACFATRGDSLWRVTADAPSSPTLVAASCGYGAVVRWRGDVYQVDAHDLARLEGAAWRRLSPDGHGMWGNALAVRALDGSLLVGAGLCSSRQVPDIGRWDGTTFTAMPLNGGGMCTTFASDAGSVYAGGRFGLREPEGPLYPSVLRWSAASLADTAGRWRPLGGLGGTCYALTTDGGALCAGGAFGVFWGDDAQNVQRWDGQTWTPLGGVFDDDVFALGVFGGQLIAGGRFTHIDGQPVARIAAWDGSAWRQLGRGIDGDVNTLLVHDGVLYAGGRFDHADGAPAHSIAAWDGHAWAALGADPLQGRVWSLAAYNGSVIAAGSLRLTLPGDVTLGIARWTGREWRSMDGGIPGSVNDLAVWGTTLVVAGELDLESGYAPPAFATWDDMPAHAVDGTAPRLTVPGPSPIVRVTASGGGGACLAVYLPQAAAVQLDVLDVRGARVARLLDGPCPAGHMAFDWPTGAEARPVRSGVYWVRMAAGATEVKRKILVVK